MPFFSITVEISGFRAVHLLRNPEQFFTLDARSRPDVQPVFVQRELTGRVKKLTEIGRQEQHVACEFRLPVVFGEQRIYRDRFNAELYTDCGKLLRQALHEHLPCGTALTVSQRKRQGFQAVFALAVAQRIRRRIESFAAFIEIPVGFVKECIGLGDILLIDFRGRRGIDPVAEIALIEQPVEEVEQTEEETPEPVVKDNYTDTRSGAEMMYVPAGNFLLGSDLSVDEYAIEYREKQKARNRKWAEKTGRVKPASKRAPKLTPEEKRERARQRSREYYASHREQCLAAKHKWYQENHEYALQYQKAYAKGVRNGEKGPSKKAK